VQGGAGTDTVVLDFARDALTITGSANGVMNVVYAGGSVKMTGVEILALRDGIFSLDQSTLPARASEFQDEVILLYKAGFGRAADADGLDYWTSKVTKMSDLREVALSFLDSDEFVARFGTSDDMAAGAYVNVLYKNVLGRAGDVDGLKYWTDKLSIGATNQADLLVAFALSDENRALSEAGAQPGEFGLVAISKAQWADIWAS
jgi:hypothetical protein